MPAPLLSALELRQQKEYSQQEVADCLGLTREGYSHYERNTREPNVEALLKLCKLYEINISGLINEQTVMFSLDDLIVRKTVSDNVLNMKERPKITYNIQHLLKLFTDKILQLI